MKSRRPTIADLAAEAGVSVATVDRVLNARLPVREATAARVDAAAEKLGYHATGLIRQRMRRELPAMRLGFVLQKPHHDFFQAVADELGRAARAAEGVRGEAVVDFTASLTPADIVATLDAVAARSDAVAMIAPDHPAVIAAVEAWRGRGVPVFALLSDFAPGLREAYVGVDNRKVGRTAAWAIARLARRPGKVALFVGSHRFLGHELREIGFRAYFREHAPEFEVLDTLVNLETRQITHEATLDLLKRHPDLTGFYVAGAGMEGAIAALREEGRPPGLVAICNELVPKTRAALTDDIIAMVIATPLRALGDELAARMVRAVRAGAAEMPGQSFLPFEIHVAESI